MVLNIAYSLDKCAADEFRNQEGCSPQHIKDSIENGPFDGKLFRLLDMLGEREGKSYSYDFVHSQSKSTDGIHSSMKRDLLIFHPPIPFSPSDVFNSENSKLILDEEPYLNILELISKCFYNNNISIRDWNDVRKELVNGAEMWTLFKYRTLDAHYSPELKTRQTVFAKLRNMERAFDNCILFERDRARDENDDIVKLIFVKQAIQDGLDRANETITVAAYKAHQTLKGTILAETNAKLNQNQELKERCATDIPSDSISWFAQLSTNPSGNVYFPETTYDAKRIVAIGHLLETNWIIVSSEQDTLSKESTNFLFAPPEFHFS